MEISTLSNEEFKVMIVKMLRELGRRMNRQSEKFNKMLENIRKNETKLKNIITEIKNVKRNQWYIRQYRGMDQ